MMKIKEIGTVNVERAKTNNGRITTFIPLKEISSELNALLDALEVDFSNKHKDVNTEKINRTVNVDYIFGEIDSPRYEFEVIIWDDDNEDIAEFYEEIKLNLSDESKEDLKKVVWNTLENSFFSF